MNTYRSGYKIIIFLVFLLPLNLIAKHSIISDSTLQSINIVENGLISLEQILQANSNKWGLTKEKTTKLLNSQDRDELILVWFSLLDHLAQLDYIKHFNQKYFASNTDKIQLEPFLNYYLAFLIQYRHALHFINILEKNSDLHTILNEAHHDLGLQENSYRQFKNHFLSVTIASEYFALNIIWNETHISLSPTLDASIKNNVDQILKQGVKGGVGLTMANAFKILQDKFFGMWFPIQKDVSNWMGETKIRRKDEALLSLADIQQIKLQLAPGDLLFERREWYLTNIGIPGYWTHVALYIGTLSSREMFINDPEIINWVIAQGEPSGNFENLLQQSYPIQYYRSLAPGITDSLVTIEGVAEGVVLKSLEESLHCDGVAVLRPRLSALEKAIAIYRAFGFIDLPYDYNFDFLTDSSMVCTEVVYKSYLPEGEHTGLNISITRINNRLLVPANNFVRQFDREFGTEGQQLDLILFFDGNEKSGQAFPSTLPAFRKSWKRPDWYLYTQKKK